MRRYPLDEAWAAELKRRRLAAGLTQAELARRAGAIDYMVMRYETLRSGASPAARSALERALVESERGQPVQA